MILNIIVLIFEVLYYSMFMYYARKEGKFWRYLLSSTITTILLLIVGSNNLIGLLVLVVSLFLGIKYIIKIKTSLYDMFFVLLMIFFKLIIEFSLSLELYYIIKNIFYVSIITGFIKIMLTIILKNKFYKFYLYLRKLWYKNNFYIRYIFSCLCFIYCIISIIFLITKFI